MTNTTMVTNSSFPDNWFDIYQSDQPLNMDAFIQSDLFAARRNLYMKEFIAQMISAPISFIASILLVVHILRSHECLSSTYHRLIFGLSAADIISSFGFALASSMAPKEMSYLVPFASGNIATCDAQGFLIHLAACVSVGYTCSVCFFYLAIITYNKKRDYIQKKLEPWFHGISILFPMVINGILLATHSFNGADGGQCDMLPHIPPHCIGYEAGHIPKGYSIPCGRGGEHDGHARFRAILLYMGFAEVLIIAPAIILLTMTMMFRSVAKIEKKMEQYGVRALRFRATLVAAPTANNNSTNQEEERGFAVTLKKLGKYLCSRADATSQTNLRFPCAGRYDPERPPCTTKCNKMKTKKRAVLYMAFGYAGSWLLVWAPFFVQIVFLIVTKSYNDTVLIVTSSMTPLQGLLNFIVFMAPKVRTTRTMAMRGARTSDDSNQQNQQHLTWCQAFYKAYMDRGRRLEDRNMRNNNRTERRNIKATGRMKGGTFRTMFERMKLLKT
jgi:hypothetical protein